MGRGPARHDRPQWTRLGSVGHGRTLGALSGGQRGRLALAMVLVRRPSALLLDEPTNHLDDEAAAYLEEQEEIAVLRDALGVTTHRVVRNTTRRLEELERRQVPAPAPPLRFHPGALTEPAPGEVLVALREVHVPGRLTVDRLDVPATARLLITGANGSGKSTLLAVLAGKLEATGVRRQPGVRIGMLRQDTVFARPGRTARELYEAALGPAAVPLTSLGLLGESEVDKSAGVLSAGQRRRLAPAVLVARQPQLLLLDEPTNHLSPRLCDELEDALGGGPGAIVLASHDRWLRKRWQGDTVWLDGDLATRRS